MVITAPLREPATSGVGTSIRDAGVRSLEADWQLLYETYRRPILRYLLKLIPGSRGEAEDHLQETFLRAWRWLQSHPFDLDGMRPWLYAVARRIVIDAVRSRRVRPVEVALDDMAWFVDAGDDIERLVRGLSIRKALLRLSADHRAALMELFYHERTAKEAADVLGIPEGTVKSRAHYALHALRTGAALTGERDGHTQPHGPPAVHVHQRTGVRTVRARSR